MFNNKELVETLEKILEKTKSVSTTTERSGCIGTIQDWCIQALASQKCDVTECPAYVEHDGEYWQGYWEFNDICQEYENHCSDNPNCNFKIMQYYRIQKGEE